MTLNYQPRLPAQGLRLPVPRRFPPKPFFAIPSLRHSSLVLRVYGIWFVISLLFVQGRETHGRQTYVLKMSFFQYRPCASGPKSAAVTSVLLPCSEDLAKIA